MLGKPTKLYFLTAPCSVVPRNNLGKRVQDKTKFVQHTRVLAFEVRDMASPGLDPEDTKLAQRQLISLTSSKMVFKLNVIGKGKLKS